MADRIAVLEHGRVVQMGQPEELYESPASPFVARFLGDSNVFLGAVETDERGTALRDGQARWVVDAEAVTALGLPAGASASAVGRPERMTIGPAQASPADTNLVSGVLAATVSLGAARKIVVDLPNGRTVQVRLESRSGTAELEPGRGGRRRLAPGRTQRSSPTDACTLARCPSAPRSATSPSSPTSTTARRRSWTPCSGSRVRSATTRTSQSACSTRWTSSARRASRSSPRTRPSGTGRRRSTSSTRPATPTSAARSSAG